MLAEALDSHVGERGADDLGLAAEEATVLGTIFPALASGSAGGADKRQRAGGRPLLRALRLLLARIGEDTPLVLALDDLHWADPASIDFVCHLLHRGPEGRVLLLCYFSDRAERSDQGLDAGSISLPYPRRRPAS